MKTIHSRVLTAGCALGALLGAGAAAAQEPAPELESVVVTARLEETMPEELAKVGNRLTVIPAEQIDNGGYYDVGQALQAAAPGLAILPKAGAFDYVQVSLQGSRNTDVLFLIDGVRIQNRLYNGTTAIDTVPAHMVDHIEVLEGGQSLFYGTQALAGVVNIVTKPFTTDTRGQFSGGLDTNKGRHVNGYVSGSLGAHQFVAYASSDQAEGYRPFSASETEPSATDRRRSYDVVTLGAKYGYDLARNLRFSALYQHTDAKLDLAAPARVSESFNKRDEDLAWAKLDYTSPALDLYVKGYFHDWDSFVTNLFNEVGPDGALTGNVVGARDVPWNYNDYGANVLGKLKVIHGVDTFVGYDLQKYGGFDEELTIAPQKETVHAVFGQLRTNDDFSTRARLAAGLRYNKPVGGPSAAIWNVSGQFDLTDDLFVRASASTSFRLPDAESLFADYYDPSCDCGEVGNPDLKPERGLNVNASIGGRIPSLGGLSWELVGYHRVIKDLIDYVPDPTRPNFDTFANTEDEVRVRGAEFTVTAKVSPSLSGALSATYNHARLEGSNAQVARIPKSLVKASLDYHPTDLPFGAGVAVNYVGSTTNPSLPVFGVQKIGDYAVVDLDARLFLDRDRHHRLSVRLENAFDTAYSGSLTTALRDDGSGRFLAHVRGTPRTLHASYTYGF